MLLQLLLTFLFASTQPAPGQCIPAQELFADNTKETAEMAKPTSTTTKDFDLGSQIHEFLQKLVNSHYNRHTIDGAFLQKAFQTLPTVMDPMRILFLESDIAFLKNITEKQAEDLILDIQNKDYSKLIRLVKTLDQRRQEVLRQLDFIINSPSHRHQILELINTILQREAHQQMIEVGGIQRSFESAVDHVSNNWAKSEQVEIEHLRIVIANLMIPYMKRSVSDQDALVISARRLKRYLQQDIPFHGNERLYIYLAKSFFENLDPHSKYWTPKEYNDFTLSVSDHRMMGIITMEVVSGLLILEVNRNSPADNAGLRIGDLIVSVNNQPGIEIGVDGFTSYMQAQQNPRVEVVVNRDGKNTLIFVDRSISATGSKQVQNPVRINVITNNNGIKTAIIGLSAFYKDSAKHFRQRLREAKAARAKGIVIDLRDNGGGSLTEATHVQQLFTDRGQLLWQLKYPSHIETNLNAKFRNNEGYKDFEREFNGPVVVLVDNTSASASELTASVLRAKNVAIIVGSPQTYGKGSAQARVATIGGLQITEALFYNSQGYSTQFFGAPVDIVIHSADNGFRPIERDYPNAIVPSPLDPMVNPGYIHVSSSAITGISELNAKSQQRQMQETKSEDPALDEANRILNDWLELSRP